MYLLTVWHIPTHYIAAWHAAIPIWLKCFSIHTPVFHHIELKAKLHLVFSVRAACVYQLSVLHEDNLKANKPSKKISRHQPSAISLVAVSKKIPTQGVTGYVYLYGMRCTCRILTWIPFKAISKWDFDPFSKKINFMWNAAGQTR